MHGNNRNMEAIGNYFAGLLGPNASPNTPNTFNQKNNGPVPSNMVVAKKTPTMMGGKRRKATRSRKSTSRKHRKNTRRTGRK